MVEYGQYKGCDTITLRKDDAKPDSKGFTFGRAKAKLIVANYDDIQEFANSDTESESDSARAAA